MEPHRRAKLIFQVGPGPGPRALGAEQGSPRGAFCYFLRSQIDLIKYPIGLRWVPCPQISLPPRFIRFLCFPPGDSPLFSPDTVGGRVLGRVGGCMRRVRGRIG